MKKLFLVVLLFICGCGNKMVCTYNDTYDDVKIRNKVIFDFKKETYEQIDKMIFPDNESAKSYFDDVKDYVEQYNLKLNSNIITSNISDKIKLAATKKEIKNQYESYGYKCK